MAPVAGSTRRRKTSSAYSSECNASSPRLWNFAENRLRCFPLPAEKQEDEPPGASSRHPKATDRKRGTSGSSNASFARDTN